MSKSPKRRDVHEIQAFMIPCGSEPEEDRVTPCVAKCFRAWQTDAYTVLHDARYRRIPQALGMVGYCMFGLTDEQSETFLRRKQRTSSVGRCALFPLQEPTVPPVMSAWKPWE